MLDTAKRKEMLRTMIKLRAFEEKLEELYQKRAMFGSTHSYRGQEAVATGVCAALESRDLIASYHRGTGHLIAKGADLYRLMCECMGRLDGYSKGSRIADRRSPLPSAGVVGIMILSPGKWRKAPWLQLEWLGPPPGRVPNLLRITIGTEMRPPVM